MIVHVNVRPTKRGAPKDSFTVHRDHCGVPHSRKAKEAKWEVTSIPIIEDLAETVLFGACILCKLDGSAWAAKFTGASQVTEARGHELIKERTKAG